MDKLPRNAALIIVDVQKGFDAPGWGERNNPQAEDNIARLVEAWRRTGRPLYYIQHQSRKPQSPLRVGQEGNEIKDAIRPLPAEPVITKNVHSAFIGTDLEKRLREAGQDTVVVTGLTTDHCVSTTARMAGDMGFNTYVVADATAAHERKGFDGRHYPAEEVHSTTLASLDGEFATVVSTDTLLSSLD